MKLMTAMPTLPSGILSKQRKRELTLFKNKYKITPQTFRLPVVDKQLTESSSLVHDDFLKIEDIIRQISIYLQKEDSKSVKHELVKLETMISIITGVKRVKIGILDNLFNAVVIPSFKTSTFKRVEDTIIKKSKLSRTVSSPFGKGVLFTIIKVDKTNKTKSVITLPDALFYTSIVEFIKDNQSLKFKNDDQYLIFNKTPDFEKTKQCSYLGVVSFNVDKSYKILKTATDKVSIYDMQTLFEMKFGFTDVESLQIGVGSLIFTSCTPSEVLAIILHELGHIFGMRSHFTFILLLSILKTVFVVGSLFVPWTIQLIPLAFAHLRLISLLHHKDEHTADSFATHYGYGDDLMRVFKRFESRGKPSKSKILNFLKHSYKLLFTYSSHPHGFERMDRIKTMITDSYSIMYPNVSQRQLDMIISGKKGV